MQRYGELLNRQDFDLTKIDDSRFEMHKPFLKQLDAIESGGVLVFDTIKREHIYISPSFAHLFGYNVDDMHDTGNDFFDSRVHPEDALMLLKSGICHLEYFFPGRMNSVKTSNLNSSMNIVLIMKMINTFVSLSSLCL